MPTAAAKMGCIYFWGRGTHEYLRLDPASNFERVIWVKMNAAERLNEAGVEPGVAVAPVIDGLNDEQIAEVVEIAARVGATYVSWGFLLKPAPIGEVFEARLRAVLPERASVALSRSLGHSHGVASSSRSAALYAEFVRLCGLHGLRVAAFVRRAEPPTTFRRVARGQLPLLEAPRCGHLETRARYAHLNDPRRFENAVLIGANAAESASSLGKCDRDSVTCIAASISGAALGLEAIPAQWVEGIENR